MDKGEKSSIISRVKGITTKIQSIGGNGKKGMECEEMKLKRSEELSPDDFE